MNNMELVFVSTAHRDYDMMYGLILTMVKLCLVEEVRTVKYNVFPSLGNTTVVYELWVRASVKHAHDR